MFSKLNGYLRTVNRNGFSGAAGRRSAFLLALVLLFSVTASAYTLVLRSGRRMEIPEKFTVTERALTYEAAPGINVTILMSSIDITATERANNEPAGSLLKRATASEAAGKVSGKRTGAKRELTQEAVEAGRRARQKSLEDYERRRVELGLPSPEESRRRAEEEARRLRELSLQVETEKAEAESYWRTRALSLREEIASLDAQIIYTRARLAEFPESANINSYAFIGSVAPGFHNRGIRTRFPIVTGNPGFMRGTAPVIPGAGFMAFGGSGARHASIGINTANPSVLGRRGLRLPTRIAPAISLYGIPYPDYANERASLLSRLHELEAARAGLQARWNMLEDEARRAGVPPGWLRP